MNDAANAFNQTNRERSVTARGARHKRGGSRSKKCTLPSDHLTPAQRKEMNGNVETYKMNAPHTLKELKKWPADLRHEYMEGVLERYKPSNNDLAGMLGCSSSYVSQVLFQHFGVSRKRGGNRYRTPEKDMAWSDFVDPSSITEEPEEPESIEPKNIEPEPTPVLLPTFDQIEIQFTGTVDKLISLIQAGMLSPVAGGAYTFTLSAVRKED